MIKPPVDYLEYLSQKAAYLATLQARIKQVIDSNTATLDPSSSSSHVAPSSPLIDGCASAMSPVVKQRFISWLSDSGRVRELVDLIRMDAEANKPQQQGAPRSPKGRN